MYKIGEEELVICPYNRYHVVSKLRIQSHIIKCKRNHPEVKLSTCLYNYTHRVKPEEMLEHYEICSQKSRLEESRYYKPENYNSCNSSVKSEFQFFSSKPYPHSVHYNQGKSFGLSPTKNSADESHDSSNENEENWEEYEMPNQSDVNVYNVSETQSSDEDDLEPLPLPKTRSKAFTCAEGEKDKSDETPQLRGFGRGMNFLLHSSPQPKRKTDHLLPHIKSTKDDNSLRSRIFSHKNKSNTCESLFSEKIDDISFKSDDIIYDEDDDEEEGDDNIDDYYDSNTTDLAETLDKYVKIQ